MQMFAMLVFSYGGGGEPELSMGPFCVTRSHPTHELTDPTRPTITEEIDPTRPNPITTFLLLLICFQYLSDRP